MADPKRALDVILRLSALILSLPVQAVVAVAVRRRLGSPVLFRQQRPGLHGLPFTMVKFRTMLDPDPAQGLVTDEDWLTPFGIFLRSTSLDELPALSHVVRGQISLVGPRPLLMRYLDRYTPQQARRHEVRPGLTGLAQITGPNATTRERRLVLDVEYVETRSLKLDLGIMAKTISAVFTSSGVSGDGTATLSQFAGERSTPAERLKRTS